MRSGKRALAGVAAGALALGMLSIAGATSSSAAPSAKPKVTPTTAAASIAPVRYSTTATIQDPVKGSPLLFLAVGTDDTKVQTDDTIIVKLLVAPSNASQMYISEAQGTFPGASAVDDTLSLTSSTSTKFISSSGFAVQNSTSTDDTVLSTHVAVSEGGTYSGTIKIYDGNRASADDTGLIQSTTFAFTTAGKPTSLTLDPTTASLVASTLSTQTVTATVKDTTGALTQIGANDSFTVASASTTVATVNTSTLDSGSFDDSTATVLGTGTFKISGTSTAGSTTVTATPLGTLPGSGVTAQSVAVSTSAGGTVAPTSLVMSAPTAQFFDDTNTDDTKGYTINQNLITSYTISGAGATASAGLTASVVCTGGDTVKVNSTAMTCNGSTSNSVLVTADSSGGVAFLVTGTSLPTKLTLSTGTGSKTRWVIVDKAAPAPDVSVSPAGSIIVKTGEATAVSVTLADDFGNAYVGYRVTGKATASAGSPAGTTAVSAPTDASGKTTLSVGAPSATYSGAATIAFAVLGPGGGADSGLTTAITAENLSVTYSASGDVTSLTVKNVQTNSDAAISSTSTLTSYPTILVPYGGTAAAGSPSTAGTYTVATASGTAAGNMAVFTPTTSPANAVTVTVPTGVKVSDEDTVLWSAGTQTVSIASGSPVYVFATKSGTHDIVFTSGTKSVTMKLRASSTAAAAYNIAVTPPKQTLAAGAIGSATLKVTDVFGNPVPSTNKDDTGGVTVTATGEILLAGYNSTQNIGTDTNGEARIVILAGNAAGAGLLTLAPAVKTNAWVTGFTPPKGAPAPVTSAVAEVTVGGSSTKSITITGSRTTVSGKPGIRIEGVVTGIENGKTVIPYFRFPGETTFSQGSARPVITDGSFTWERKTGKKFYAYVTNDDGSTTSNRVIIPAN
jgi:hypothetical protein